MSRNKLATWAVLVAFIISALPSAWAEGSSDEWFYSWDYDLEDRDDDGYNDTQRQDMNRLFETKDSP